MTQNDERRDKERRRDEREEAHRVKGGQREGKKRTVQIFNKKVLRTPCSR